MAADFGKQPRYGRTCWGNETDAWRQPPGSRISYPAPRNVHLGERFSGGWPPRRNFGILVGIRWPAADDGATILSCGGGLLKVCMNWRKVECGVFPSSQ